MKYFYRVTTESFRETELETDSFQKAIDCWASRPDLKHKWTITVLNEKNKGVKYLQTKEAIADWASFLMEHDYNRVERRIMKEVLNSQLAPQESNGMEVIDLNEKDHSYANYMREMYRKADSEMLAKSIETSLTESLTNTTKEIDFHGDFNEMEAALQEAIINPAHYKMIPKEAYTAHPEGLEYMDLMEYILAHHKGVESHLLGQVFKYACRLGKKDADLQDARKIEWYATRLVKAIESRNESWPDFVDGNLV